MASAPPDDHPDSPPAGPDDHPDSVSADLFEPGLGGPGTDARTEDEPAYQVPGEPIPHGGPDAVEDSPGTDGGTAGTGGTNARADRDMTS